jgi:hypothetical protein
MIHIKESNHFPAILALVRTTFPEFGERQVRVAGKRLTYKALIQ